MTLPQLSKVIFASHTGHNLNLVEQLDLWHDNFRSYQKPQFMKAATSKRNHRLSRPLFALENATERRRKITSWVPAANVSENAEEYVIRLAVPGMDRPCFQIHASGKELIISGKKEETREAAGKSDFEYNYSAWERTFGLPEDADTALTQASYINGELVLHIPRNTAAIDSGEVDVFIY